MTVTDAQAFGVEDARIERFRGLDPVTDVYRKVIIEIVVNDDFLQRTIETISRVARTGQEGASGDGNIFVLPAIDIYNVANHSRGPGAV